MADKNPSDFRFDNDEQEPDSFYHEELKDLRIEKLSQRVTLLAILLPCLVAVAMYIGYQELSDRVSRSHDTGSLEVQRLVKELEDLAKNFNEKLITFSTTLSTQDKDFGTSIEGRLFAINNNIDELQNKFKSLNEDLKQGLKQNQDTIEKLKASKADKKSQAVAVEKINAAIKPLENELQSLKTIRTDLKTVSVDIKKLESNLTKNLATVTANSEQFSKDYEQLKASLTELSGKTIDKDTLAALELEILILKKNFKSQLSEEVSNLNQRLDTIQKEIDGIEKISGTQKQSLKKVSKKAVSQQSGAAPKTGTGSAELPTQSETISEKDLIE
jgi:DNA repair exonuclease SbcCD ATPase subunit